MSGTRKPISDRISIFEKSSSNNSNSSSRPAPSSPVIHSGKNISALKSQFSAAVAHDLEPPPKSPILIRGNLNKDFLSTESEPPTPEAGPTKQPLSETPSNGSNKSSGGGVSSKSKASPPGRTSTLKSSSSATKSSMKSSSAAATSPTKTRKATTTSTKSAAPSTRSSTATTRPGSPNKKSTSTSVSPTAKKTTGPRTSTLKSSDKSISKSSTAKRPTSPTKSPSPTSASEPSKKLSLSRIISPEPKKDVKDEPLTSIKESPNSKKDSSKPTLDRKDSNKHVLDRKESSHSVLDRKDSNKSLLDRKDSNKSLLDRKDSNKSLLDRKDSNKSLLDRKDSSKSLLDRKDSNKSLLDRKDSVKSVLDRKNSSQSVLDRKESTQSIFERKESTTTLPGRKESAHSILDRKESVQSNLDESSITPFHAPVSRQESIYSVFERNESPSPSFNELQESSIILDRKDSIPSLSLDMDERKESMSSLLSFERKEESSESLLLGGKEDSTTLEHISQDANEIFEAEESMSSVIENDHYVESDSQSQNENAAALEDQPPVVNSPSRSFPPPRCVTPPPPKEEEEEEPCPATLPTVKVTVEDIKLVKRDSSTRLPPTTVVSDPDDEEEEEDEEEEAGEDDINRLNLRNSSYSSSGNSYNKEDEKMGGYRRNSIEKHIDTRVINANYIKATNPLVMNSTVSAPSNRYWTNQALQNDNSQTISEALKLDLEFKEEKINALNKELEELHDGGAVEEEIASLKKQKSELDARLMDQEEELDDLAGQVQMLEQSKIKLEMSIAAQKKEHRKELSSKEEELEDARAAAQKRIKALEQQLESEHEERMAFVREKHDLETKIMNLQELASRSTDEEYVIKLKKNLKKTKALLKDAQCMIDMNRNDSSNKIVLRQLKNQLEDAEFAKTAAIKSRQNTEMELTEVQQQLDDVMRSKNDLEDKMMRICREKSEAQTQLEDNEEELSDIMKKYKAAVSQLSVDQITITQQTQQITELEEERHRLKETLSELNQKIDNLESDNISSVTHSRLELKIRELESKLELEQATRGRMETQIGRLKEAIEKYNHECDILRNKELNSQDLARKLQRQLRDSKEDYASLAQKEMEANAKKLEYEKQLELAEAEVITVKSDLKLALKRFDQLQASLEGDSSEGDCLSDGESDSSDCEVSIFLDHHRRAMSVQKERESVARELSAQRELRASVAREMSLSRPLETMSEHPEETSPLHEDDAEKSATKDHLLSPTEEEAPLKLNEDEGESQA